MGRRNNRVFHNKKQDNDAALAIVGLLIALSMVKAIAEVAMAHPFISLIIGMAVTALAVLWLRRTAISKMERRYRRQLAAVTACTGLQSQSILNKEESAIFYGALDALEALRSKTEDRYRAAHVSRWHLHAQVSMGEILEAQCPGCKRNGHGKVVRPCNPCSRAWSAFNAKRVDLVICDNKGEPILVIEHQGSGHIDRRTSQTELESKLRNEVKRQVLAKVGLPPLETEPYTDRYTAQQLIAARLEDIVRARQSPARL